MQIIIFNLGEEKYAIETHKVQGIDKMMELTKVPCAHPSVKGLINLRGNVITIIDPYVILGINERKNESENILIAETEGEVLGLIVESVEDVLEIDENNIKDISISKNDSRNYLKGTINLGDYIVTLIDVDAMISF